MTTSLEWSSAVGETLMMARPDGKGTEEQMLALVPGATPASLRGREARIFTARAGRADKAGMGAEGPRPC